MNDVGETRGGASLECSSIPLLSKTPPVPTRKNLIQPKTLCAKPISSFRALVAKSDDLSHQDLHGGEKEPVCSGLHTCALAL